MRRRATRNQTVKKLAALVRLPALRFSPAPAALTSNCPAPFGASLVSAGGTSYSGLRHRQQLFANFFARCDFDEHRFGRPPHLRGGGDSGFDFWVNNLFGKSFVPSVKLLCARVKRPRTHTGVSLGKPLRTEIAVASFPHEKISVRRLIAGKIPVRFAILHSHHARAPATRFRRRTRSPASGFPLTHARVFALCDRFEEHSVEINAPDYKKAIAPFSMVLGGRTTRSPARFPKRNACSNWAVQMDGDTRGANHAFHHPGTQFFECPPLQCLTRFCMLVLSHD